MKEIVLEHLKINKRKFEGFEFENKNSLIGWILANDYRQDLKFAVNIFGECFVSENIASICIFIESFTERLIKEGFELGIVVELYEFESYDEAYDACSFIKQEYYDAELI